MAEPADQPQQEGEFLIVTGMSGAGRTTAANALEDLGWYVVDNLPPQILRPLLELTDMGAGNLPKIAAVVDVRGPGLFDDFPDVARALRGRGSVKVLYLDASDDVLVRRFESVRRPHPLQSDGTLLDGIRAERARLAPIRESADLLIDTSALNIHQLATQVSEMFSEEGAARHRVTLLSFGFKYGLPTDVDHVADMRFLPNPFWQEELRAFTGKDADVRDYVLSRPGAAEFLDAYTQTLRPVLEGYQRENKSHSTIAIGCTGGKHRSVAMAEELARRLADTPGVAVNVRHRDLGRE
ncbi:RNase adapter RapZ [Microbacterium sp. 2216-1]|uniref:RNase adapter RapZ n=1 Tax=Microbacterium TaxID=33882 RepID=UPI0019D3E6C3|nr:RNase adapter RapZ [Microbacterium esteraromaticum]